MIRKFCPNCRTYSYSASQGSPWACATCNMDLSREPVLQLDERAALDVAEQPEEEKPEKKQPEEDAPQKKEFGFSQ